MKQIIFARCVECPYFRSAPYFCCKYDPLNTIELDHHDAEDSIPEWCELEDRPEDENEP